jgi:putative Ca2+/H+ antiporter (TMEM165/GDT1 family)
MAAFFTIFLTVFLAELGDKTQLATALFASKGDINPLLVFAGSAAALVASAGLATLLGGVIGRFVDGPTLKIAAGLGFIAVGVWTLWGGFKP